MKEDRKLGLKVAENSEEAMWSRVKKGLELDIKTSENSLKISREFLKAAEIKLKEAAPKEKKTPAMVK